ncbi:MAG TPA: AsmA family protein, partial [Fodinibius sp.]|nr:AsmA family protein [Fodinibius sp.]
MKTFLKITAAVLALLFIIIIGLNLYFTSDRLQNMLMPYINESVGRTVEAETMSITLLSTFPNPGVEVTNLVIPGDTEEDTLLSLKELTVGVELFPLFRDEINFTELSLDTPRFTYQVYADSSTNLDFLLAAEETDTASTGSYDINIPYFEVSNGYFGYRDLTSHTSATLDDLNGDLSLSYADSIQSSIDIEVGGLSAAVDSASYIDGLPLQLTQESVIYADREVIRLKEGTFSLRGLEMDLAGTLGNWSEAFTVDLQFNSSTDNFGNLLGLVPESYAASLDEFESSGTLDLGGTVRGMVTGDSIPRFDIRVNVQDGYLKDPDLSQPVEDIQIAASATNELVTIETFHAAAGSNAISGSGTFNEPLEDNASFNMNFTADVDLSTVHQFYDIAEMDIDQLGGQLDIDANAQGPLDQPENISFDGKAVLADGLLKYREVPRAIQDINVNATGTQELLAIKSMSLQAAQNTLSADGEIQHLLDESNRHVTMNTSLEFDLSTISEFYPIDEDTLQLEGQLTAQAALDGQADQIERTVQSGRINLENGFVDYGELDFPLENITLESTLEGPRMTLDQLTFNTGSSDIDLRGSLSNYVEFLKDVEDRDSTPLLT